MAKKPEANDPFANREAEKYDNPIPSREYIMEGLEKEGRPRSLPQLVASLELESEEQQEALRRRLRAMERDGQLIRNRRGGYGLASKMDLVRGRVIGHADGFGFLTPDEGGEDLFLSASEMDGCLHGDRVIARVSGVDRRGRKEGSIVEVLEYANTRVVGRYYEEGSVGFLVADNKRINQDILIPADKTAGVKVGQFLIAEILQQPSRRRQAIGQVVEILGDHMAPGMEIDIAMHAHSLPQDWPVGVETDVAGLPAEVLEEAKQGRIDLRDTPLVTIDGEDSMDFDDAVYCEPKGDGWRLLVAIADVSHYVQVDSALDTEARNRGNSVYFPGRVIPMLPEALSNGLCSLNPDVDRLCMVCDMDISADGKLGDYKFYPAVMRSHARLTYNKMASMVVDNDPSLRGEYAGLVSHLDELYRLFKALNAQRKDRGAIDFDTTETRIVFGEDKKIERIVPVTRNDAHRVIEECMLIANVAAADYLARAEIPVLYRVHEGPKIAKLTNLREFLAELGLPLGGGDKPQAQDYAVLLRQVQERPDAGLIQTVMLRSLSQAIYTPDNKGHFGLSYEAYAHFTSPIRRYPDLLVHRAIRHLLAGGTAGDFNYGMADMLQMGEHNSMTERRADDATRDATDWLKCEFMLDKVGEEYEGMVTGVTGFGLFVQLDEIYVEGLVHVTSLDNDYYHFDAAKHRLMGERSNKIYRLADKIKIKVAAVNLDDRKIDFGMVGANTE